MTGSGQLEAEEQITPSQNLAQDTPAVLSPAAGIWRNPPVEMWDQKNQIGLITESLHERQMSWKGA